jgi:hypothetical protein
MSGEGIFCEIKSTKRGRKILAGSFVTANTGVPTSQLGDAKGVTTRTGVGSFIVTLPKKYGECEAIVASCDNGSEDDKVLSRSYYQRTSTGILSFSVRDISGAAATETTGVTVNFIAVMNDRSS